ncbi:hypothetical protein LVY65_07115 [Sphingomonas sp. G124]|uniref:Uncharacterized protein n=1 Tax=Sphingomonas cremea TaxID=2904799 RepID=A0A9X1QMP1_9SPHN|nr:hypothetical protein [Sphingomonas cremea]MCF2514832.1 hypothetical protein [Sphingomonas cremea]
MFLHRIVDHLKTQNWTAVGLDLAIVIVGVFVGTQVSNWNQGRLQKRETAQLLVELKPALNTFTDFFAAAKIYYATTHDYSDRAFAGWRRDPNVSNEQFVIAAYQASQIYTWGLNGENWASIFGSDQLRDINDADVRLGLTTLMTISYDQIDSVVTNTAYREDVRQVIPEDIQDAIRANCDDQVVPERPLTVRLPRTCDLPLADAKFAEAAAMLRSHPELIGKLRWHRAAVAAFMRDYSTVDQLTRDLQSDIDKAT